LKILEKKEVILSWKSLETTVRFLYEPCIRNKLYNMAWCSTFEVKDRGRWTT